MSQLETAELFGESWNRTEEAGPNDIALMYLALCAQYS
jgi:hypothetical protein